MPTIHPTAILTGEVTLADDVVIGPGCVLTGPVTVGPGCVLLGSAYLNGPLAMGARNVVYPFVCLGFAPQSVSYNPNLPGRGLVIGDGNTFREGVTIHRAMTDHGPTTIGAGNYFMANSHAGHDCIVGNNCILANGALLAGHVRVDDRVVMGGSATVHQFCRIGRGAMLSGNMGVGRDLPPFFMLTGINVAGSINLVGLRRSGMSAEDIEDVRWVYKTLYRRGLTPKHAIEALHERAERPLVQEYIEFLSKSQRGFCPGQGQTKRNAEAE